MRMKFFLMAASLFVGLSKSWATADPAMPTATRGQAPWAAAALPAPEGEEEQPAPTINLTYPEEGTTILYGSQKFQWEALTPKPSSYTVTLKWKDGNGEDVTRNYTSYNNSYSITLAQDREYTWSVSAKVDGQTITSEERHFRTEKAPDLVVTSITGVPERVNGLTRFSVTATIRNQADAPTHMGSYSWYDRMRWSTSSDGTNLQPFTGTSSVAHNGELAAGESYDVTFTVTAPDATLYPQIWLYVEANIYNGGVNDLTETDKTNNTLMAGPVELVVRYVDADDYEALKVLYNATDGPNWSNLYRWKIESSARSENAWPGVTFDDDGHVTALALNGRLLVGDVPAEGFNLPRLTSLNLQGNDLKGDINAFVQGLPALTSLNLGYNLFTELSEPLPTRITSLQLGSQYTNFTTDKAKKDTLIQELHLADISTEFQLPSLYAYDHAKQNFDVKPNMFVRVGNSSSTQFYLRYSDGAYRIVRFLDNFKIPQGSLCSIHTQSGTASGSTIYAHMYWLQGDANTDGAVDVRDAQHTLNYFISTSFTGLLNYYAADTYTDDNINVQDVVAIINLFLDEDEDPIAREARMTRAKAQGKEMTGQLTMDGRKLALTTTSEVAALDITLEGVTARQIQMTLDRNRYQMIARDTQRGVRVVLISPTGDLLPTATTLLRLTGDARVTAVQAADAKAESVLLALPDDATAIDAPHTEATTTVGYDLMGRKMTGSHTKGIRIENGKKTLRK